MRSDSLPRSSPRAAQMISSVIAPKAQRQKTTSMMASPDMTTNHPIVPRITIAAVISTVPRAVLSMNIASRNADG